MGEVTMFVGSSKNDKRAIDLLTEASEKIPRCKAAAVDEVLGDRSRNFAGKVFLETRDEAGELCGVAMYDPADIVYVMIVCSRCPGTGRKLMQEIINRARAAGKKKIQLVSSDEAEGFYKKLGVKQPPGRATMTLDVNSGGRRKTYRRRRQRKHGSASLRRHKA